MSDEKPRIQAFYLMGFFSLYLISLFSNKKWKKRPKIEEERREQNRIEMGVTVRERGGCWALYREIERGRKGEQLNCTRGLPFS